MLIEKDRYDGFDTVRVINDQITLVYQKIKGNILQNDFITFSIGALIKPTHLVAKGAFVNSCLYKIVVSFLFNSIQS